MWHDSMSFDLLINFQVFHTKRSGFFRRFSQLIFQVICAVLKNLTENNWLIQMAATRALELKQPADVGEAGELRFDQSSGALVVQTDQ